MHYYDLTQEEKSRSGLTVLETSYGAEVSLLVKNYFFLVAIL